MRVYDLVLVLRPTLGVEERKNTLETVKKWLGKATVEIEDLSKKTLAYPIKKEREGLYILLKVNYSNGSALPADIERRLLTDESILRHLLVRGKVEKNYGNKKS